MKSFFTRQFESEVLVSEKLRTRILAGIFIFGTLCAAAVNFVFTDSIPDDLKKGASLQILLSLLLLSLFELLSHTYIERRIQLKMVNVPVFGQYLNAALEISAPAAIMLIVSNHIQPGKILHSPAVNIYFIFIILSTLRLNYRISLFIGFLAAIEFFAVSRFLIARMESIDLNGGIETETFAATGKVIVLLLSGISAAFVARQIRSNVEQSLIVADRSNKIISLFGKQVSKEVVDEMLNKDGVLPAKLMRVCIMFIDIRNFTGYVADKSPAEIVEYQNAFFKIIVRIILKHHGIINQFLGDGCMVTFGAPLALANPSEHAIKAALEIRAHLNDEFTRGAIPRINIGIGIHEGDAVTGNIGPEERQQYSITGSVVILAARIEQLNKEYNSQILISENVMAQAGNLHPDAQFLGRVNLKGWIEPVGIYKVA